MSERERRADITIHPNVRRIDAPRLRAHDVDVFRAFLTVLHEIELGFETGRQLRHRSRHGGPDPLADNGCRVASFGDRTGRPGDYAVVFRFLPPRPHDLRPRIQILAVGPKSGRVAFARAQHRLADD